MEDESLRLITDKLPHEWVTRTYKPDYGIDLSIEIFKYVDSECKIAETLGDFLFAQVKSVSTTKIEQIEVYGRKNVAKGVLEENRSEYLNISVIKHELETSELLTIESMGHSVPVLLLLVCLDSKRLFFLCLNDLIDKVIVPVDPDYAARESRVIAVPTLNEITSDPASLTGLRFYAKRPKFYAAFSLFEYQRNELSYASGYLEDGIIPKSYSELVLHFIRLLERLDIWEDTEMWTVVGDVYKALLHVKHQLHEADNISADLAVQIEQIWNRLLALSHNYEEICREWFLPTHIAQYLSYPDAPTS